MSTKKTLPLIKFPVKYEPTYGNIIDSKDAIIIVLHDHTYDLSWTCSDEDSDAFGDFVAQAINEKYERAKK